MPQFLNSDFEFGEDDVYWNVYYEGVENKQRY